MTDDRQQQKKSCALILPKNLEFWKDRLFLKNGENLIFFHSSVPVTTEGNDGRPTTATTDDGEKILCTHFAQKS